jgi:hypothetical protein
MDSASNDRHARRHELKIYLRMGYNERKPKKKRLVMDKTNKYSRLVAKIEWQ